jgi:hypothetical protein
LFRHRPEGFYRSGELARRELVERVEPIARVRFGPIYSDSVRFGRGQSESLRHWVGFAASITGPVGPSAAMPLGRAKALAGKEKFAGGVLMVKNNYRLR